MVKSKGVLILGGVAMAVLGVLCAFVRCTGKGGDARSSKEQSPPETQVERPKAPVGYSISAEEATVNVAQESGLPTLYDLYTDYYTNNLVMEDPESPCNQGRESLVSFVEKFSEVVSFQKARTELVEGSCTFKYGVLSLAVAPPDSTYYFAAWSHVASLEASFCRGYLGSEMLEEYTFTRRDESSHWLLTDYFQAGEIIE